MTDRAYYTKVALTRMTVLSEKILLISHAQNLYFEDTRKQFDHRMLITAKLAISKNRKMPVHGQTYVCRVIICLLSSTQISK